MACVGSRWRDSLWENDLPSHFNLLLSKKIPYSLDIGTQVTWDQYQCLAGNGLFLAFIVFFTNEEKTG